MLQPGDQLDLAEKALDPVPSGRARGESPSPPPGAYGAGRGRGRRWPCHRRRPPARGRSGLGGRSPAAEGHRSWRGIYEAQPTAVICTPPETAGQRVCVLQGTIIEQLASPCRGSLAAERRLPCPAILPLSSVPTTSISRALKSSSRLPAAPIASPGAGNSCPGAPTASCPTSGFRSRLIPD